MELKPTLKTSPSVSQQLVLSPRLYQSLSILRLAAPELQELIQKELVENPTLEIPEPSEMDQEHGNTAERELWDDYLGAHRSEGGSYSGSGEATARGELAASPVTLTEHLTTQLELESLDDRRRRIGLAIIGSLDEDGYLREPLTALARTIDRPESEIEEVLALVQHFDPPGVAARDLAECLAIQLEQMNSGDTAISIARDFLPKVARGAYTDIAKTLSISTARVRNAVKLIRSLCPSPGSLFDNSPPASAIIPDIYARLDRGGKVRVLANREILPSLRLSRLYKEMAEASNEGADRETTLYVKEKIQEASRLIRDIDHRRTTVTKVARAIADSQPEFFTLGPEHLRPLGLEEIAEKLEVHPSTVSRAILGKYMSTPYGIFEFRYFFSAGYATSDGDGLSSTAVKKRLAGMISAEDHRRPLSDQKLAKQLGASGLSISRRTVAKYREALGISASWERKQIK
ncbi:MAG: RNA polymerase factor sigma-54 [Thermoleophilia bacterium]|nr:RNA polymerase factor sigma-54 [Thermoleophilia bacterium]